MEGLTEAVLNDFVTLLSVRFGRNVFTTEDSVRYTLYAALLKAGITPTGSLLSINIRRFLERSGYRDPR